MNKTLLFILFIFISTNLFSQVVENKWIDYSQEYYKIKNSWGDKNDFKGYLYVSKAFVQLKTTSIYLHEDALSKDLKSKFKA